jgi:hypothetical protein
VCVPASMNRATNAASPQTNGASSTASALVT